MVALGAYDVPEAYGVVEHLRVSSATVTPSHPLEMSAPFQCDDFRFVRISITDFAPPTIVSESAAFGPVIDVNSARSTLTYRSSLNADRSDLSGKNIHRPSQLVIDSHGQRFC
jgi:hypothetical protein